jgi:hypothetical protein
MPPCAFLGSSQLRRCPVCAMTLHSMGLPRFSFPTSTLGVTQKCSLSHGGTDSFRGETPARAPESVNRVAVARLYSSLQRCALARASLH